MKRRLDARGGLYGVLRFAGAVLAGALVSLLFFAGVGLIFFAAGAITHASYQLRVGPLLLLQVATSADSLNLLFGPGMAVVIAAFGLFNGVLRELLRRRRRDRTARSEGDAGK